MHHSEYFSGCRRLLSAEGSCLREAHCGQLCPPRGRKRRRATGPPAACATLRPVWPHSFFFAGAFWMRSPRRFSVLVFILLHVMASPLRSQQTPSQRPVAISDLFALRDVHDPQISPDGHWVAYSIGSADLDDDKFEERIWMSPAAGGDAIALTAEDVSS